MSEVTDRLLAAMNGHDVDVLVACFAPDYRSEQPTHPSRAFVGSDQVRENWTSVFAGVADFAAELVLSATTDEGVELDEWRWRGTYADGSPFEMRGITVLGIERGRIAWARLYMDAVEADGADIREMVQDTYRPPA